MVWETFNILLQILRYGWVYGKSSQCFLKMITATVFKKE